MSSQTTKEWIEQSVRYFQAMGFLQTDAQLEEWQIEILDELLEKYSDPKDWYNLDQILLHRDTSRVWDEDWEISFSTEDAYTEAIQRWSTISRGVFLPENINITWIREGDIIFDVNFEFRNKPFVYRTDLHDWIDPFLLNEINELIQDTGICLYACNTGDQTAFVVALTAEEQRKLEQERGWACIFVNQGKSS